MGRKFKNIDLFGMPLKWRMFQEDLFTSNIGACTTLFLPIIICIKLFLFYNKSLQYGFARTRITNEFQVNNYTIYNFTEFEIKMEFYFQLLYNSHDDRKVFKYEDYFDINFYYHDFSIDVLTKKNLQKINCTNQGIYNNCFKLHNDLRILNSSNLLFLNKLKTDNYQDQLDLFKIIIKWKKKFEDIFKNFTSTPSIVFSYNFFKFSYKNLTFYKMMKQIDLKIDSLLESETQLCINKISLDERMDFDFLNFKIKKEEKFYVDPSTITRSIFQRDLKKSKYDQIIFSLNNNEEKYEIITLSLDDILSVIGGFIQLIFSLARVIIGIVNEILGEKLFNEYCSNKIQNYDKRLNDLKLNINNQKKNFI